MDDKLCSNMPFVVDDDEDQIETSIKTNLGYMRVDIAKTLHISHFSFGRHLES